MRNLNIQKQCINHDPHPKKKYKKKSKIGAFKFFYQVAIINVIPLRQNSETVLRIEDYILSRKHGYAVGDVISMSDTCLMQTRQKPYWQVMWRVQ